MTNRTNMDTTAAEQLVTRVVEKDGAPDWRVQRDVRDSIASRPSSLMEKVAAVLGTKPGIETIEHALRIQGATNAYTAAVDAMHADNAAEVASITPGQRRAAQAAGLTDAEFLAALREDAGHNAPAPKVATVGGVQLTASQLRAAKTAGLTPEEFAEELKREAENG